jgi:hypothetical protein
MRFPVPLVREEVMQLLVADARVFKTSDGHDVELTLEIPTVLKADMY